jgi:membrane-bound serine protease (ClpP class)
MLAAVVARRFMAGRALEMKVVDLVATDVSDLLAQADGRQVMTTMGEKTLATKGIAVETVEPGWRTALLTAITDPNIALILMTIGVYGLLFEFMNPGAVLPGALGGICLIVGLYALNTLPVNYAGLGLILLGLGLLVAEAFAPSFGALGLSGIAAFILGAVILFDTGMPGYRIAWPAIAGVAGMGLLFTFIVIPFAVKAQRRKVVSGWEEMIGADVTIEDWAGEKGHVSIKGERWRARASRPFRAGETARISALDGLTLVIEPSEAPIAGGDAPCSTS